jgi:hypothetical protein
MTHEGKPSLRGEGKAKPSRACTEGTGVHVSVRAAAVADAGYGSLTEGLTDLALRRMEADLTPACEVPGLDGDGSSLLPVATDGAARAYRQHLYDRGVSLSALRVCCPPGEGPGNASAEAIRLGVRAAETIGAPVICLDRGEGAADGTGWLPGRLSSLSEETAGTRVALAAAIPADARVLDALVAWLDDEPARPGLALEIAPCAADSPPPGFPYDAVRVLGPWVRHVVCGTEQRGEGEGADPRPLAEGRVDYARIAALLGSTGYAGALTMALPAGLDAGAARQLLRADAAYLKDIIGEY